MCPHGEHGLKQYLTRGGVVGRDWAVVGAGYPLRWEGGGGQTYMWCRVVTEQQGIGSGGGGSWGGGSKRVVNG